jgi:hypothetical protein
MLKLFDNTFFKFFFGFIFILLISFGILYVTQNWGKEDKPDTIFETSSQPASQN